jgi:hypothetical protein
LTRRLTHALASLYAVVGLGLAHCSVVSWHHGSLPYTAFFAGASILCVTAVAHHSYQRDEIRHAHAEIDALKRAPAPADASDASDGVVAVALAAACCERWWTSAGAEHEPTTCTRRGSHPTERER